MGGVKGLRCDATGSSEMVEEAARRTIRRVDRADKPCSPSLFEHDRRVQSAS